MNPTLPRAGIPAGPIHSIALVGDGGLPLISASDQPRANTGEVRFNAGTATRGGATPGHPPLGLPTEALSAVFVAEHASFVAAEYNTVNHRMQ